jgi:Chaperone of endosialidase
MANLPIETVTALQVQNPIEPTTLAPLNTIFGQGGFAVAQMTTVQMNALITATPLSGNVAPFGNGAIVYNSDTNEFNFYQDDVWIAIPSGGFGDVSGPEVAVAGEIAIFADTTGKLIADGGPNVAFFSLEGLEGGYQIGNLGAIQFTNESGVILVDTLIPVTFSINGGNSCSVFTDGLPEGSTSPSAVVELNTTTGALLLSRMTTAQMNALLGSIVPVPIPGLILYNTETNLFMSCTNEGWEPIGNLTTPPTTTQNGVATWGDTTGNQLLDNPLTIENGFLTITNSQGINISGNTSSPGAINMNGNSQIVINSQASLINNGIIFSSNVLAISTASSSNQSNLNIGTNGILNVQSGGQFNVQSDAKIQLPFSGTAAETVSGNINTNSTIYAQGEDYYSSDGDNASNLIQNIYNTANHYFIRYNNATGSTNLTPARPYSIVAKNYVAGAEFDAFSSLNIKNILNDDNEIIGTEALELFNKLPFKKYEYKDKIKHGDKVLYGMIAEEIREILPHSVSNHKDFIPNIMQPVDVIETANTKNSYDLFFRNKVILDNAIKEGDRIQLIDKTEKKEGVIKSIETNVIVVEVSSPLESNVFIYGTYGDCPAISKDNIFEMGMVVLQSLIRKLQVKNLI